MDVHTHEDMSDQKYLSPFDGKFFTNHKIGPFNCHAILDRIREAVNKKKREN